MHGQWSSMLMHQEVTANYGYMEKYLATEAGIQMMLTVGQVRMLKIFQMQIRIDIDCWPGRSSSSLFSSRLLSTLLLAVPCANSFSTSTVVQAVAGIQDKGEFHR